MDDIWTGGTIVGDKAELIADVLRELAGRTGAFDPAASDWMAGLILAGYQQGATKAKIARSLRDDARFADAVADKALRQTVSLAIAVRADRSIGNAFQKLLAQRDGGQVVLLLGKEPCDVARSKYYGRRLPASTLEPPFDGCSVLDCTCRLSRAPH